MDRDSNSAGFGLVMFLLGAAVGAGIALLYAPQEGKATRRELGEKATAVRDKASEVAQTAKEKVQPVWDKAAEVLRRGQQTVEDGLEPTGEQPQAIVESPS